MVGHIRWNDPRSTGCQAFLVRQVDTADQGFSTLGLWLWYRWGFSDVNLLWLQILAVQDQLRHPTLPPSLILAKEPGWLF